MRQGDIKPNCPLQVLEQHGLEAGRGHVWDFLSTPENRQAAADAGPPVLTSNKDKKQKQPTSTAAAAVDEAADSDDDVMEGGPAPELTWWEFGKGPPEPIFKMRPASDKVAQLFMDQGMLSEQGDDSSDDEISSDDELSSEDEQGELIMLGMLCFELEAQLLDVPATSCQQIMLAAQFMHAVCTVTSEGLTVVGVLQSWTRSWSVDLELTYCGPFMSVRGHSPNPWLVSTTC